MAWTDKGAFICYLFAALGSIGFGRDIQLHWQPRRLSLAPQQSGTFCPAAQPDWKATTGLVHSFSGIATFE
jgi:hypothetical protein